PRTAPLTLEPTPFRSPISDPPLRRAELFAAPQLEAHARELAATPDGEPTAGFGADGLLPALESDRIALGDAYALLTGAIERGSRPTPAAEWFVDNYPLIEEQIRTARRHLPRGYARQLPTRAGPRIHRLAAELIAHTDGRVDLDTLRVVIDAYRGVREVTLGELWALPIMLRLGLIAYLRRVVGSITAGRRDRDRAGVWVERMTAAALADVGKVVLVLADLIRDDPPMSDAFVAELAAGIQGLGTASSFPHAWLDHQLAERGQSLDRVLQRVVQSQAADQVSIGNAITSLRFLGATDWRSFVEGSSAVEATLRADPTEVYPAMDFASRDAYRHVVESLARRSRRAEAEVAAAAIALAVEREVHVGAILFGSGRPALEQAIGLRPGLRGLILRNRFGLYLAVIGALTAGVAGVLAAVAPTEGLGWLGLASLVPLLLLAGSQLAVAVVHWAATILVPPRLLPRLDFSGGIPPAHRTLVAVPTLLTDAIEIDLLLEALEVRHLANADAELGLALVTDFRDADAAELPGDQALLARVRDGIDALNREHAAPGRSDGPFFLLHRPRRWNPQ
ncbi:MAG: cyclic beta 1-2 glucan synthetase, partial [Myxococcota bacterium]